MSEGDIVLAITGASGEQPVNRRPLVVTQPVSSAAELAAKVRRSSSMRPA